MGKEYKQTNPSSTITIAKTFARTGRSIKNFDIS
jgi:hypothetical protein